MKASVEPAGRLSLAPRVPFQNWHDGRRALTPSYPVASTGAMALNLIPTIKNVKQLKNNPVILFPKNLYCRVVGRYSMQASSENMLLVRTALRTTGPCGFLCIHRHRLETCIQPGPCSPSQSQFSFPWLTFKKAEMLTCLLRLSGICLVTAVSTPWLMWTESLVVVVVVYLHSWEMLVSDLCWAHVSRTSVDCALG